MRKVVIFGNSGSGKSTLAEDYAERLFREFTGKKTEFKSNDRNTLMISAKEVLDRLKEGNQRFVSGAGQLESGVAPRRCREFLDAQDPIAIILGCSDSRVPVEMIFDQELGELFVIRVAGNVVSPSQIGSVEYARSVSVRH